ncbi:MAG: lipopolysaccharide biosynthesis protein [Gemmatimonadota bacterium]|nr:lipopolysaccharide biosynthesis protein [Gemmatimonadota bacterium]
MSERAGVAGAAARGMAWAMAAAVSGRVISVVGLVVLARLLAPEDFGLLAIALVIVTYLETLGDLGVGAALVYWPRRAEEAARLAFAVNVVTGAAWGLAMILAAPWLAGFFERPDAVWIIRAMALSFPVKALGNAHDALLRKELRFRARMLPEVGMGAAKAAVAIALAAGLGWGAWSLVVGHLAGLAVWTAVLWRVEPWRPGGPLPLDLFGPMLRYGRGLVAVNVLAAVVHHADLVVVGRMLGATALGFYQIAYKVPEMSIAMLIWVAGRVLFPAFSRIHAAGEDVGRAYVASIRYVSLMSLPAAVGLVLLAEPIVTVVFGSKWAPAAPMLQALAVYIGLRSVGTPAGDVLKGTGRTGLLAGLALVKAIILVPALIWAGGFDASAVAWTMAAVAVVTTTLNLGVVQWRYGVPVPVALRGAAPGGAASAIMAAAVLGWTRWVASAGSVIGLAAAVLVGALVYVGAVGALFPDILSRAKRTLLADTPPLAEGAPK